MTRQLRSKDYTVGWVCALPVEFAAAKVMLDERHDERHDNLNRDISDNAENIYCLGSVAGHNVAIVCLPAGYIGNSPAATVASQMRATFKGIRFGLMVGIGGGVPSADADIRLGDVVVSQPYETFGGVVQYDLGKVTPNGFKRTGLLNSPPQILLSALNTVKANEFLGESTLSDHISKLERTPNFQRSKAGDDVLFKAGYNHKSGVTCDQCSTDRQQARPQREREEAVVVHYGTIASGNQVMESAVERDKVSAELGGVLCFEMEAAGLMNHFPCLVIRGICDYADSHKNERWQAYAAGTAAAWAKELLSVIPKTEVIRTDLAEEVISSASKRGSQALTDIPVKRRKTDVSNDPQNSIVEQQASAHSVHQQKSSQPVLNSEQRQKLLDSLRFDHIDTRQMTIRNAHAKTCKWLLENPDYLNWLDLTKLGKHYGFLWIRGKPGAGKSTLMKFALINAREKISGRTVIAFFFNGRGEDMEKSTIGAYRSLLLQLLKQIPTLQVVLDSLGLSSLSFSTDLKWEIEPLKMLIEQAVRYLGESSVICFIDALDECEEEQIRDMIQFFEHIGELAVSDGIHFQVCFSSRHYPHITLKKGLTLVLERQEGHYQDITNYLETELKIGKSETAQKIRNELQEKASGVFMWVVLAIGILNWEHDHGQIHTLQQKVKDIPNDLHNLFRDILVRDSRNKDKLILCIQWVLFAKRPLSPEQLYFAIRSGTEPEAASRWDTDQVSQDVIRLFLLDSSKGLTEVTTSKAQRVQFIHESVKDFLLKENGLRHARPELGSNLLGQSHEQLKQCCLTYMCRDIFAHLRIPSSLPKASSQQAADLRKSASDMFPFLEYAVQNVLHHADLAEGSGIAQGSFIQNFPLISWIQLNNVFEKHQVRRYTEEMSLLYALGERNLSSLIRVHPSAISCFEVGKERYGPPLFAALATGSKEALSAFIDVLSQDQLPRSPPNEIQAHCYENRGDQSLGRNFQFSNRRSVLSYLAQLGNEALVKLLLKTGRVDVDAQDKNGQTPLLWAAENGHEAVVKLLLETGKVNVEVQAEYGQTPLSWAAGNGHEAVVKLLLEKGKVNVDVQADYGQTPLSWAAENGREAVVKLLLETDKVNVDAQDKNGQTPLSWAAENGHEAVVKLLLETGKVNVEVQDKMYGRTPLSWAAGNGHEAVVKLLLETDNVNIDARNKNGQTPLSWAVENGREAVVKLLLETGKADVNALDENGRTPLSWAVEKGHDAVVKLLRMYRIYS